MKGTQSAGVGAILDVLVARHGELKGLRGEIEKACALLIEAFKGGRKLLVCGNGGSAADADHIVGEFMKGFVKKRPLAASLRGNLISVDEVKGRRLADTLQASLPAIALGRHTALHSAFGNDADPGLAYAQEVLGYGVTGDVFLGISTSGNASNVVHAAVAARARGLGVIALTGVGGGNLAELADILLAVPERETWKVQELHLPVYHAICLAVESALFPD